ncbi:MAG: alpha/beta fold hydrolase [Rhizobiaceae bacterium]
MPTIKANGIDIFYDEFGSTDAPVILLIMGLATQMIAWPESLCEALAADGFRVIRFDNRDIGLSAKMENAQKRSLPWAILKWRVGLRVRSAYSLDDMAADAIGLMDALKIGKAHIVGASMGGMIAQIIAAKHPERCLSLTSIMSTSGARHLPHPTKPVMAAMTAKRPPSNDPEAVIQFGMHMLRTIGSPGFPTPEPDLRAFVIRALKRSAYPPGFVRQLMAVLANGSRVALLKTIRVPTLVLHGEDDPLVPVEGGRDTARHVPGAKLTTIPGWGHDLPAALVPRLVAAVAEHCKAA